MALEFENADVEKLRVPEGKMNHGFEYLGDIPPEKIKGICRIPDGAKLCLDKELTGRDDDEQDLVHKIKINS